MREQEKYILETDSLTKKFKGFSAVSNVNLRVRRNSIHGLIGPNGAGKTTVFNMLTKFLMPTSGGIKFQGLDITRDKPAQVAQKGLIRSFQISSTFPHMTVLENVRIALQRVRGSSFDFWRSKKVLDSLDQKALDLLESVDLLGMADVEAVELPYGQKRALELATTLALEPDMMLLDEPTQGMAQQDVARVVDLIKKVAEGRTVLMVEHNLSVVQDLCDAITVLQRGSVLTEGDYRTVSTDPRVLEAYVGRPDDG